MTKKKTTKKAARLPPDRLYTTTVDGDINVTTFENGKEVTVSGEEFKAHHEQARLEFEKKLLAQPMQDPFAVVVISWDEISNEARSMASWEFNPPMLLDRKASPERNLAMIACRMDKRGPDDLLTEETDLWADRITYTNLEETTSYVLRTDRNHIATVTIVWDHRARKAE